MRAIFKEKTMKEQNRLAVVIPGIGYTCDRSLLYFTGRLAETKGYETVRIAFHDLPKGAKGNPEKMYECFLEAKKQLAKALKETDWDRYRDVVFIAKSLGTAVAAAYAKEKNLPGRFVLLTPLKETFDFIENGVPAVAFHGTADPWAQTDILIQACGKRNIALYITDGANHSLETGDPRTDIETLQQVIEAAEEFLA